MLFVVKIALSTDCFLFQIVFFPVEITLVSVSDSNAFWPAYCFLFLIATFSEQIALFSVPDLYAFFL
jgi:hypothetical protein